MTPYWHYIIGFLPLIVLMFINNRKLRIIIGCFMILLLFLFWGGISKKQAVERDFIQWTLEDLAKRSEKGQNDSVCSAICIYNKKDRIEPFNGYEFMHSIQTYFKEEENKTKSERTGSANQPASSGRP